MSVFKKETQSQLLKICNLLNEDNGMKFEEVIGEDRVWVEQLQAGIETHWGEAIRYSIVLLRDHNNYGSIANFQFLVARPQGKPVVVVPVHLVDLAQNKALNGIIIKDKEVQEIHLVKFASLLKEGKEHLEMLLSRGFFKVILHKGK